MIKDIDIVRIPLLLIKVRGVENLSSNECSK